MHADAFSDRMQFFPMHATGSWLYFFLDDLKKCPMIIVPSFHMSCGHIKQS